jgi:uncharacterized protein (DUF1697 family)
MTIGISLLRGVNVGGNNQIKMQALKDIYQSLGLRDVQTYIQSGNVVFSAAERNLASLEGRIEAEIERNVGFRPRVVVRTLLEWQSVIAKNPFATRPDIDASKLLVMFLTGDPGLDARQKALSINVGPEELRINGRHLYIYFPEGMGRSKLPPALDRALKVPGTGRNWNTILKLSELAQSLEARIRATDT